MSFEGKVKAWVGGKGFGFIEKQDGSGDLFVHFRQIQGGRKSLNIGEKVTYTLGENPKSGRPVAENVVGDGMGTPVLEANQVGFVGRGGSGSRGGFAGRGEVKWVCYAFRQGQCNFGENCRFSHEVSDGVSDTGYGRGFQNGYGGKEMGPGRRGLVYGSGLGRGSNTGGQTQESLSPNGAHRGGSYAHNERGVYANQTSASYGSQVASVSTSQGIGGCGQQGTGGYGLQVGGFGRYQQGAASLSQQGAIGSSTQEGIMNNSYRQQGVRGFASVQPGSINNEYASSGHSQHLAAARNNMSQQGGYAQHDPVNGYNGGGAYTQHPTTQANCVTGGGYPQHC